MKFGLVGDPVNLASRLEGACKFYGVGIVTSDTTRAQAGAGFVYRHLDKVVVKGKTKPTKIYEVVCRTDNATENQL
jgi:adenylate cyclase